MLENVTNFKDLISESKNSTDKRYDEYLDILNKKESYDDLDVIDIYLKLKFRDNLSLEASNNSMRSKANIYFDKACTKIQINKDALLKHLSNLHNEYRNDDRHYMIIDKEIDKIIFELRRNNNMEIDKEDLSFKQNIDIAFSKVEADLFNKVGDALRKENIYQNWSNVNLYKDSLITEWKDGQPSQTVACIETYMLTDKIGSREENIGCYYGQTRDRKFLLIPQGFGYINKTTGSYLKSESYIYDNIDEFIASLVKLVKLLYKIKYNV